MDCKDFEAGKAELVSCNMNDPSLKMQSDGKDDVKVVMLYDPRLASHFLSNFSTASGAINPVTTVEDRPASRLLDKTVCSVCDVVFLNHEQQSSHFKSGWHLVNVRLQLRNCPALSEAEFSDFQADLSSSNSEEETTTDCESDNVPNTSGSDATDAADDNTTHTQTNGQKVVLSNANGKLLSINRCLVANMSQEQIMNNQTVCETIRYLSKNMCWIILMASGGHFAGAVFDGEHVKQHKTFHRYVVRAKRGTSQSTCDNKRGSSSNSAGAALRRYNEIAFVQEIQDLLASWSNDIARCSRIFLRAPGRNRLIFFPAKNPILCKTDPRVCPISVQTKRPTFRELKRIHRALSTVHVLDENSMENVVDDDTEATTTNGSVSHRTPSPSEISLQSSDMKSQDQIPTDVTETMPLISLSLNSSQTPNNQLLETESAPQSIQVDNSVGFAPESLVMSTSTDSQNETDNDIFNELYTACKIGAVDTVEHLLENNDCSDVINRHSGSQALTLLHISSKAGNAAIVKLLLQYGADPSIRNLSNNPPYVSGNKEVKSEYRRFMADNMNLYDYVRAQIPGPLTDEIEAERKLKEAARKKNKRNAKKEKLKEMKVVAEATEQKKLEENEKLSFLALSDREKRAYAAEKRLELQRQTVATTTMRCWQCGTDLSEKVPFEYFDYKFCSSTCLKAHRLALP